jgi:hypothetical protein
MQRSIVDALPNLDTQRARADAVTRITSRRPMPRWLLVFGFWTLIVFAYSTRGEVRAVTEDPVVQGTDRLSAPAPPELCAL